jgi:hypothetical protein
VNTNLSVHHPHSEPNTELPDCGVLVNRPTFFINTGKFHSRASDWQAVDKSGGVYSSAEN